jgi:hypothetical protein
MQSTPSKSKDIYKKSVARQGSGKHASTTMGDGVFIGVHANGARVTVQSSEFSVEDV